MKKGALILIIIIIIIGVGYGAYYFIVREEANENQVIIENKNQGIQNQNTNTSEKAPTPIYDDFKETEGYASFAIIKEWTSIAPEEVVEGLSEEDLFGYQVVYYAINDEGLIQTVSKKPFTRDEKTINQIFNDDFAFSKESAPDYQVINKEQKDNEIRWESPVTINNTPYTIFSRGVLKTIESENKDWYYLLEVIVPAEIKDKYSQIISYLLISMEVTGS